MGHTNTGSNAETLERLVALPEVKHRTTLSRTSIWRFVKAGTFPQPVHLTPTRIAWKETDVLEWIASRVGAKS